MAILQVEIKETDLKRLVRDYICEMVGHDVPEGEITILVKSKQNYKSEWEPANFKATYIAEA